MFCYSKVSFLRKIYGIQNSVSREPFYILFPIIFKIHDVKFHYKRDFGPLMNLCFLNKLYCYCSLKDSFYPGCAAQLTGS